VLAGTGFGHPGSGTEASIPKLTRDDVIDFWRAHYRSSSLILGLSSDDASLRVQVLQAISVNGSVGVQERKQVLPPLRGRRAVVIEVPNAPAASLHLGFPIDVQRTDADFWPLLVANLWLGTHRDSFGRLYQSIREERGYNYGDYSYLEHWDGRTESLFQVFNQPRRTQYFSIWLRPVAHEYARHLLKAATFELERLVREGLTAEEVKAAKRQAKVLYLSLAETTDRLLAARVDDSFYRMSPGYLEGWLRRIDAVTPEAVNAALKAHLRPAGIKYLVVTDSAHARKLAEELRAGGPAYGKGPKEYLFEEVKLPDGKHAWQVPDEKVEQLRLDGAWARQPLGIEEVKVVPVTEVFKSGGFPVE
jgi:zinc protease